MMKEKILKKVLHGRLPATEIDSPTFLQEILEEVRQKIAWEGFFFTQANQWIELGIMYYAEDYLERADHLRARICFEEAVKMDLSFVHYLDKPLDHEYYHFVMGSKKIIRKRSSNYSSEMMDKAKFIASKSAVVLDRTQMKIKKGALIAADYCPEPISFIAQTTYSTLQEPILFIAKTTYHVFRESFSEIKNFISPYRKESYYHERRDMEDEESDREIFPERKNLLSQNRRETYYDEDEIYTSELKIQFIKDLKIKDSFFKKREIAAKKAWEYLCRMAGSAKSARVQEVSIEDLDRKGNREAIINLIKAENPGILDFEKWYALGEDYFFSFNGKQKNYILARVCYEEALNYDSEDARCQYRLGEIYHHGYGIDASSVKSREFYWKSYSLGFRVARKSLKELERDHALMLVSNDRSLDETDSSQSTLLHWAARQKHLKNCARLLVMGASKEVKDGQLKIPFAELTENEMIIVTTLQSQICQLAFNLQEPASVIIAKRIFVERALCEEKQKINLLENLYRHKMISPLLDLAKLAALALHDLSGKKKLSKENYDSDDDFDEKISDRQYLTIRVDPDSSHVCNIAHYGEDSLGGKEAQGVFLNHDLNCNTIYLGGNLSSRERKGTLAHELTHFVATEVFNNNSYPYEENDDKSKKTFVEIANDLESKASSLNPILSGAFSAAYKKRNRVHAELIVRVAQLIVTYPDGLLQIQQQAPHLLGFYINVFLEAVKKHVLKLENRTLSGWSRSSFLNSKRVFLFEEIHSLQDTGKLDLKHTDHSCATQSF